MQELGSQVELLVGLAILALATALAWWSDRVFDRATKFEIAFPDNSDMHDAMLESRKAKTKAHARRWWTDALLHVALITFSGFLIFRVYGAVTLCIFFSIMRVIPGFWYMKADADPLKTFENYLVIKAAIIPFSETLLRLEIERCIQDGRLLKKDYSQLLQHLSKRNDIIGEKAQSVLSDNSL